MFSFPYIERIQRGFDRGGNFWICHWLWSWTWRRRRSEMPKYYLYRTSGHLDHIPILKVFNFDVYMIRWKECQTETFQNMGRAFSLFFENIGVKTYVFASTPHYVSKTKIKNRRRLTGKINSNDYIFGSTINRFRKSRIDPQTWEKRWTERLRQLRLRRFLRIFGDAVTFSFSHPKSNMRYEDI